MLSRQTRSLAVNRSFAALSAAASSTALCARARAFHPVARAFLPVPGAFPPVARSPPHASLAGAFRHLHLHLHLAPHPVSQRRRFTTDPMPTENHGEHDTRSKRKQPPTPSSERPMKQIKPEDSHARNGTYAAAEPEPVSREQTPTPSMDMSIDGFVPPPLAAAVHDTAEWQKTIETVVKSVVSIHFCQTCSFDTDPAVASEATGFVVDAERGYILTNRVGSAV